MSSDDPPTDDSNTENSTSEYILAPPFIEPIDHLSHDKLLEANQTDNSPHSHTDTVIGETSDQNTRTSDIPHDHASSTKLVSSTEDFLDSAKDNYKTWLASQLDIHDNDPNSNDPSLSQGTYNTASAVLESQHQFSKTSVIPYLNNLSSSSSGSTVNELSDRFIFCPICQGGASLAVTTNCNHNFCGNCILLVWSYQSWLFPIVCPYCRQKVSHIWVDFTPEELATDSELKTRVVHSITLYNSRFSEGPRTLIEKVKNLPLYILQTIHSHNIIDVLVRIMLARGILLALMRIINNN